MSVRKLIELRDEWSKRLFWELYLEGRELTLKDVKDCLESEGIILNPEAVELVSTNHPYDTAKKTDEFGLIIDRVDTIKRLIEVTLMLKDDIHPLTANRFYRFLKEIDRRVNAILLTYQIFITREKTNDEIPDLEPAFRLMNSSDNERKLKRMLIKYIAKKRRERSPNYEKWLEKRREYGRQKQKLRQEKAKQEKLKKRLVNVLARIYDKLRT